MTQTSAYNRVVFTITLIVVIAHSYYSHIEYNNILTSLANHQQNAIQAFTQLNATMAQGILNRAQAQVSKDQLMIEARELATPAPVPTPKVITKTRVRTRISSGLHLSRSGYSARIDNYRQR